MFQVYDPKRMLVRWAVFQKIRLDIDAFFSSQAIRNQQPTAIIRCPQRHCHQRQDGSKERSHYAFRALVPCLEPVSN
jgi:hypothetical protein